MTFPDVVMECLDEKEFVENWERLYGHKLMNWRPPRNTLEAMIDEATGSEPQINADAVHAFIRFVWEFVWMRLPAEAFAGSGTGEGE